MTLGWIVYAVVLGAAFALAAVAVEAALVVQRRSTRWVWCASLTASLGAPLVAYLMPPSAPATSVGLLPALPLAWVDLDVGAGAGEPLILAGLELAFPYLWGLASTILLAWLIWGDRRLHVARHRWPVRQIDGTEVLESRTIGPAVVGLFGSRIAIPDWLGELDADLQRLAVLHEREHQRRRDPLLLWAGWLACAAVPWNPVVWWQLRRLRLAIEVDCDRRVLDRGVPVARYGELLLEVGRRALARPLTVVALSETRSFLERRIRAMTSPISGRAVRAVVAIVAMTLVITFAVEAPAPARDASRLDESTEASFPSIAPVPQDTPPRFAFTPYTVKPRCVEGCTADFLMEFFRAANAPPTCDLTIGILIDTEGRVTATDVLKSTEPACEEGARAWAVTTRWTPAQNEGRPVDVWMAQPIVVARD